MDLTLRRQSKEEAAGDARPGSSKTLLAPSVGNSVAYFLQRLKVDALVYEASAITERHRKVCTTTSGCCWRCDTVAAGYGVAADITGKVAGVRTDSRDYEFGIIWYS